MFKFRGQRKDNGEWVVGYYVVWYEIDEDVHTIRADDGRYYKVHPSSLSIGFSKLDSTDTEIFASFPLDDKMTTGGDVVSWYGGKGKPIVFEDSCFWFGDKESDDIPMFSLPSHEITIIGKGGGNDK